MSEKNGRQNINKGIISVLVPLAGIFIIALLLIVTTLRNSRSVSDLSDESIISLGEFYLNEITERNVNNINIELDKNISLMKNAVSVLDNRITCEKISVNDYAGIIRNLNGLDSFAFTDDKGNVYSDDPLYNDTVSGYVKNGMNDREFVSITKNKDGEAVFIIYVPVSGEKYGDINITSCISVTKAENIMSSMLLQGEDNQCYCRLFTNDGENILSISGDFPENKNLFDVYREKAVFKEGFSLDKFIDDWKTGNPGYIVYSTADAGNTYVYYQPVPGTNLMMTALMRQNIINTQISQASQRIYRGGIIQLLSVIAAMIIIFWIMTVIIIRNRRIQFEKEKEEALLRQEKKASDLRAEIQEKVLEEERQIHRHDDILRILSHDYTSIFYVDLIDDIAIPYRIPKHRKGHGVELEVEYPFRSEFERNMRENIFIEDLDMMLGIIDTETLKNRFGSGSSFTVPYRMQKNGIIQYSLLRVARVGEEDDLRHIVLGYSDIDEQTRAEQEKQNLLKDALAQAENANQAKTQFLSNMSHDIRTPMNAVIGYTSLVRKNLGNSRKVLDYIDKIEASGTHLISLINDILDMSRIESGRIVLENTVCALSHIIYEINSIVQTDVRSGELEFTIDTANVRNDILYCDRVRLSQVLLNCVSNAVKYTPPGGKVRLSVNEHSNDDEAGVSVFEFRITDTGIGIKKEFAEHIFEPFERERNSTVSGIQGTGLGLAITKSIVDMMNGSVSVVSEEGKGSEFTVVLPLRVSDEKPETDFFESIMELPEYDFKNVHILIVEDNQLNREIAEEILNQAGITTDTAENGKEAIQKIADSPAGTYSAVLMDIQMPVMDGYEAVSEIRKLSDPVKASVPVIAMTANAFEEDRRKAVEAGMNEHIAKPIDTLKLFETIKKILGL